MHCDCSCVREKICLQPRPYGCPVPGITGNPDEKVKALPKADIGEKSRVCMCVCVHGKNTETKGKREGSAMLYVMGRGGGANGDCKKTIADRKAWDERHRE